MNLGQTKPGQDGEAQMVSETARPRPGLLRPQLAQAGKGWPHSAEILRTWSSFDTLADDVS